MRSSFAFHINGIAGTWDQISNPRLYVQKLMKESNGNSIYRSKSAKCQSIPISNASRDELTSISLEDAYRCWRRYGAHVKTRATSTKTSPHSNRGTLLPDQTIDSIQPLDAMDIDLMTLTDISEGSTEGLAISPIPRLKIREPMTTPILRP